MPRRAQGWANRLDGGGARRPSRDGREARRRARRPEHQEQHLRVRPSPRPVRRRRRSPTLPIAPSPAPSGRHTALHCAAYNGCINPPWRCSSAAPTRPSRTTMGNAVPPAATPTGRPPNRPESAQENASPRCTSSKPARRVRRGGGGGAAAGIVHALLLQPGRCAIHATTRTQHCTDRALRPTPTHPRHVVRVGLRAIRWCCRTAAGRAGT